MRNIDTSPQPLFTDMGSPHAHIQGKGGIKIPVDEETIGTNGAPPAAAASLPPAPSPSYAPELVARPIVVPVVIPKPACKIVFDLGDAGRITAWYHRVVQTDVLFGLVYDTRYTDGIQFEPPVRRESFDIVINQQRYAVIAAGLELPLSDEHVHVTILIRVQEAAYDDDQERGSEIPHYPL